MALLVVAGLILYCMTPDERRRLILRAQECVRSTFSIFGKCRLTGDDPFYAALLAQRRVPLITYMLATVSTGVLIAMMLGPEPLGTPDTIVAWGGSFGPRTTDTERWRVFTSSFVHRDAFHTIVNISVLIHLGLVLERMVGPFTFALIFMASGAFASTVGTATAPMSVCAGSGGAVSGLYGLLLATTLRSLLPGNTERIPLSIFKRLGPAAAIFALYCVARREPLAAARAGLCAGFVGGIVLTRRVPDQRARLRRFAALGAATAVILLMSAMGLRAVTDIRPSITAIIANEEHSASEYDEAVLRFRKGTITSRDLSQIIDRAIVPRVQRDRQHLAELVHVPADDAPLVTEAMHYLHLRHDSWRTRSEALRKGNMAQLKEADKAEHGALEAFARIRRAAVLY
ncbi:MAG: rhomboid family intramembrane serine protease [Vicinamibacterales bacterium]